MKHYHDENTNHSNKQAPSGVDDKSARSSRVKIGKRIRAFVTQHAFIAFLLCLGLLVVLIAASESARQEKLTPSEEETVAAIDVVTYDASQGYLTTQAQVVDEGVIDVLVQTTSGVVQRVNVTAGQHVSRGQRLVNLSNTYGGANVSALQLELAEKNWLVTHANYWDQEKLDDINLELNQNTAWTTRWETNGGSGSRGNGDAYTSYKGLQNAEILQISDTMSQRGQQLSLDQAENNYFQAQIAASLMYPATPVSGVVQKVNVSVGQVVSAGTPVAVVRADKAAVKLKLSVSESIVRRLAVDAPAYLDLGGAHYPITLDFLPTTPTSGNSYALSFTLDDQLATLVTNGSYVAVRLPLETSYAAEKLIPINAIYQTQTTAYAYVAATDEHGQLVARQTPVTLGPVIGSLVAVTGGLQPDDQIILNNTLRDGQAINITTRHSLAGTSLDASQATSEASIADLVHTKLTLE